MMEYKYLGLAILLVVLMLVSACSGIHQAYEGAKLDESKIAVIRINKIILDQTRNGIGQYDASLYYANNNNHLVDIPLKGYHKVAVLPGSYTIEIKHDGTGLVDVMAGMQSGRKFTVLSPVPETEHPKCTTELQVDAGKSYFVIGVVSPLITGRPVHSLPGRSNPTQGLYDYSFRAYVIDQELPPYQRDIGNTRLSSIAVASCVGSSPGYVEAAIEGGAIVLKR